MVAYFGDFADNDTVNIPFNTFDSNDPSNSVTATDLIASDIYVHKDGSATAITTDGATIDIDAPGVGAHMVTIDTNADAAYTTGSEYAVRVDGVTVDGGTVNAWIGAFSIERAGGVLALMKATTLASIKAETALIVADTDVIDDGTSGLVKIASDVAAILSDTGTDGVLIAAGALTDATLAGALEIVYETDFGTNYNVTRNAWETNVQDFVGTTAADPFAGKVVAASVAGNVDGNVSGSVASNLELGPAEVNAQCDASIETYGLDHLIAVAVADEVVDNSIIAKLANSGATADWSAYVNTTDSLMAIRDHIGDGTNLTEAGGDGDHLSAIPGASDPWSTALPGAYGAGTAGEILGDWKNGERLDLILDIIAADTTTDIPGLIATAQSDLDKLTGTDGATLATAQGNYAPAKAGDSMDILSISGDTDSANNLELQYDGTGYVHDTAPGTQAQLSNISNVGSAVNSAASAYTLTTGTQSLNTVASVVALDGANHEHTDDTAAMDLYYEFAIGSGTPSSVTVTGYLNGNNDDLEVYGYDWVATGWVRIGTLAGKAASTNEVNSYNLFTAMVGTGANFGTVRVRFTDGAFTLSTATLAVDQIYVSFSAGASIYDDGAIWIDTALSNTNTVSGVDGVSTNPVSTIAAANTLAANLNLNRFRIAPASSITFAATQSGQIFIGDAWTLALGGQDITDSKIIGATVSGIASGTGTTQIFDGCILNACSHVKGTHVINSGLAGTQTVAEAGEYFYDNCHSAIAGAGSVTFDFGAALNASNFNVRHHSGGWTVANMGANTGTYNASFEGNGQIVWAASCSATSNASIRGSWKITDNASGAVTETLDDNQTAVDEIGTAGAGLTNINLPNQTMDIVGDITGNLSGSVGSLTGHTNQTGDSYAIVNGSAGLVAIDTVVDAIKVTTDKFQFTVANFADCNIQYVNDVLVNGTGAAGDEWGP